MIEKVENIYNKYKDTIKLLAEVQPGTDEWVNLTKQQVQLRPIAEKYEEYCKVSFTLDETIPLCDDPEIHMIAEGECEQLRYDLQELEDELQTLLTEDKLVDDADCRIEIRSGVGGDEACLFAAELLDMYLRYCARWGFKTQIISKVEALSGGLKEVIVKVSGKNAYDQLKFESGCHRVQRVPITESKGRIHTSAATVAVLKEGPIVKVIINPEDVRIDTYHAGGHGGQNVNKTDSAVRLTHIPTGTVVECQDERSQKMNKDKAWQRLRDKIEEQTLAHYKDTVTTERRTLVGSGDRSEKIRTYNFLQDRLTDHRISKSIYGLDKILQGNLDELIQALDLEEWKLHI